MMVSAKDGPPPPRGRAKFGHCQDPRTRSLVPKGHQTVAGGKREARRHRSGVRRSIRPGWGGRASCRPARAENVTNACPVAALRARHRLPSAAPPAQPSRCAGLPARVPTSKLQTPRRARGNIGRRVLSRPLHVFLSVVLRCIIALAALSGGSALAQDYAVTVQPAAVSIVAGGQGQIAVGLVGTGGFASSAGVNLPEIAGVTFTPALFGVLPNQIVFVIIDVDPDAAPRTVPVTLQANSPGYPNRSATFQPAP